MSVSLLLQDSPDFELVRKRLHAAGFNEESICARLGIPDLGEFSRNPRNHTVPTEPDELSLLTRLLVLGETLNRDELEATVSSRVVAAMTNLGLLSVDADAGRLCCSYVLYPVEGTLTVSDRWMPRDGKEYEVPADFVYPAIAPNTLAFLAELPVTPCDHFVELCSGAGTVALAASRYSRHAWAVDITERSTQMAEFNRLLNGIENVTVLRGDCYEGLEGLQFDRIVAHPPYMPVAKPAQIFYDGGQDGEQVTRRLVQELPKYLRPGGCFYCLAQGSDRKSGQLEQRLRGWLGDRECEFDVAFLERRAHDPQQAAMIYAMKSKGGYPALNSLRESFSKLGIESLSYGWIIIQRRNTPRGVFTARRSAGPCTGREEIAWLLNWETFAAGPSASQDLLQMAPVARASLELHAVHRLKEGALVPEHLALHSEHPFAMNVRVDPWMVYLIPLCDGKSTVQQMWETCKAQKFIHPETPAEEFARLIAMMISGGFIEVADYRPPDPVARAKEPRQHHDSPSQTL